MQKSTPSKSYGNDDVWWHTFNSQEKEVEYVHVRDFKNNMTYAGWVKAFSDTGKPRELLLKDAIVYDDKNGNHKAPLLLIELEANGFVIEFPYLESEINGRT